MDDLVNLEGAFPGGFVAESEERLQDSSRLKLSSNALFPILERSSSQVHRWAQLDLKSQSDFNSWCQGLDVPVAGTYPRSDAEEFWRRGWFRLDRISLRHRSFSKRQTPPIQILDASNSIGDVRLGAGRWGRYEFKLHPFRIFPMTKLLESMRWSLVRSNVLYPPGVRRHAERHIQRFNGLRKSVDFLKLIDEWNGIADLAILLEPLYWPSITGWTRGDLAVIDTTSKDWKEYRDQVLSTFERVYKASVAQAHESLRFLAAKIDNNSDLYLLARASIWDKRLRLKNGFGQALWLRHIAEVLRLAYDEVYEDRLVHEDIAFGMWVKGARQWAYGSEFPLEDIPEMVSRVLPRFGLVSQARVRVYVEGDTEEGAIREALGEVVGNGVDVVNLRAKGWSQWLTQELKNDCLARRFSIIIVDGDRSDVIRTIASSARNGLIVGMVFVNEPDFELGCFSPEELCKAVSLFDAAIAAEIEPISLSEISLCMTGKDLEQLYCSKRLAPKLKGSEWGCCLARTLIQSDSGLDAANHRFVQIIGCILRAITTDYEAQKTYASVDPDTLLPRSTGRSLFGTD